ncbi:hypothetical protein [Corynebacterium uterequi]|uniref:PPE family protein n=1 Tax=Corynebacterium uterequi TaxID=1072256 RepID=A0A0G3HJ90_9CORY|nr:hypothetical protein [Corynebacterium uterequi]AKK12023.1 hypothetical protein CUTER_10280 [Corynebacterium uterequi]
MNFIIEPESFNAAAAGLVGNVGFAVRSSRNARLALIDSSYSTASGYDQLGTIHGLSLNAAPGSAETVLRQVGEELDALADNLITTRRAYEDQDDLFARILRRADTGGVGTATLGAFTHGGLEQVAGMHRQEVLVTPAASLDALIAALAASNAGAVAQSLPIWADITLAATNIGEGLIEVSNYIGANNYGETTDAIINRLQRSATASTTIATNATHFETTLAELEPARLANLAAMQALKAELTAMAATGPEAAGVADMIERVALAHNAVTTQATLSAITPRVISLTSPVWASMPSPTTAFTSADGAGVGFDGTRFIAPQGIVDAVLGFADAHPEKVAGVNAISREMARHAGLGDTAGLIAPEVLGTHPSTVSTWSLPSAVSGVTTPATTGHGASMTSPGGVLVNGRSIDAGGLSPAARMLTSGVPRVGGPLTNGTGVIGRGVTRVRGARGAGGGAAAEGAAGRADRWASSPDGTGRGVGSGRAPSAPYSSGGSGYGAPAGPGGSSLAGTPASGSTASPASQSSSPMFGGMGAGAGAGRGQGRKKRPPKIMITEVERDANRLALLGEPRKVLPGVIGEWIYEDPDDPNGTYPNKI